MMRSRLQTHGWHPHYRYRIGHQLLARQDAVGRWLFAGARSSCFGRGVCADGVMPRVAGRRVLVPARRLRSLARLVPDHPRHAVYCYLFHQPGRRSVQGLRAQLCRGTALDAIASGGKTRDLATHHRSGRCLALQQIRRTRRRRTQGPLRVPPKAQPLRIGCTKRAREKLRRTRYFQRTGSMSTVWLPSPSIKTPS